MGIVESIDKIANDVDKNGTKAEALLTEKMWVEFLSKMEERCNVRYLPSVRAILYREVWVKEINAEEADNF
jgi:hypothetical protein